MGRWRRVVAFVGRWANVLLPVAVGVLFAASQVVDREYQFMGHTIKIAWVLIVAGGLLATAGTVITARRQLRLDRLENERNTFSDRTERAEAALLRLIRAELISLEARAHLYSNERVSLFRCDGDGFSLVGRRSRRPLYDESLGRKRYTLEEGVLGAAWAQGAADEPALPDPGPEGGPARRVWLRAHLTRWRVPEAVASSLVMRSQSYVAIRIEREDRSLGAIVFESTVSATEAQAAGSSSTKRTRRELEVLVKEAGSRLASLIEATQSIDAPRVRALLDSQQGPRSRQGSRG
jgi:hypothetical protein